MPSDKAIAKVASLIGDKARAAMLLALMDGTALTASELALRANISAQTASNHLNKLSAAKLVICEASGRYRYYRLASHLVAGAIEQLGLIAEMKPLDAKAPSPKDQAICAARTCYDHLAGKLGVMMTQSLIKKRYIQLQGKCYVVTKTGEKFFKELDIDCDILKKQRRHFAKPCLDWTERQYHLSGSLAKAILDYCFAERFVIRAKRQARVIVLTAKGKQWFNKYL